MVLKQVSIGQALIHAARPRSSLPPILFGTAVELDHVFGSKWLMIELSRLGFCLSSEEVGRYKQSVVSNEDISDLLKSAPNESFSQWSADNNDHNVKTIDGKGSLHAMGIIVSTTGGNFSEMKRGLPSIPRQRRLLASELVRNKGVPLLEYHHPQDVTGLSQLKFKKFSDLQTTLDRPVDCYLDLLWHALYFKRSVVPRPGWNGYMQMISTGQYPGQSAVNMLSIIDLDPTNISCIYSTLIFILEQAKTLNVINPVVTFDQPLWIKATEIVNVKKLPIVLILGGFHMLMSFAGSIGTLMGSSGLSSALETIYGPVSVTHVIWKSNCYVSSRELFGRICIDD